MLTRSMFAGPRMRVQDLQLADVPGRLESGVGAASDVLQGAIQQLPGQKRQNALLPWLPGLAIVGILLALLATSWWMVRGGTLAKARERELAFDQVALDRAADDGMPAADDTASGHMVADGSDVGLDA